MWNSEIECMLRTWILFCNESVCFKINIIRNQGITIGCTTRAFMAGRQILDQVLIANEANEGSEDYW